MKKLCFVAFLSLLSLLPLSSLADSVNFSVGKVNGTLMTGTLLLRSARAFLECDFISEKSGSLALKKVDLETHLTRDGYQYQIEIQGGELNASSWFNSLSNCSYRLALEGMDGPSRKNVIGLITLAGSATGMSQGELADLLADQALNESISIRLQPLELFSRGDGFISTSK